MNDPGRPGFNFRAMMDLVSSGIQQLRHHWRRVQGQIRPYFTCTKRDSNFLMFCVFIWLLLLWVTIVGDPQAELENIKSLSLSTLTLPFSTGWYLLENIRHLCLGLPDLFVSSKSSKSSSHDGPFLHPSDDEEIVQRIMSDPGFKDLVKKIALEELQPIRKEIIAFTQDKLKEIRDQLEDHRIFDALEAKRLLDNEIRDIEQRLTENIQKISDSVEQKQEEQFSNFEAKLQPQLQELPSGQPDLQAHKQLEELEKRFRVLSEAAEELSVVRTKCCQSDKEIQKVFDQLLSSWLNEVIANTTDRGKEFNQWLEANFMTSKVWKDNLERLKDTLINSVEAEVLLEARKVASRLASNGSLSTLTESSMPPQETIQNIIEEAIRIYDADKTGRFDFALESAGGTIASTRCTETHDISNAIYSVFGIPFWWERNSPRTILQPGANPGECWAFKGSHGTVVVKLSSSVIPEAVSLEHMSRMISPDQTINSAPKDFSVYGLESLDDQTPTHLGNFTYSDNDSPVQTFDLIQQTKSFQLVELKIKSNHGHLVYTCLYRFRVHGKL